MIADAGALGIFGVVVSTCTVQITVSRHRRLNRPRICSCTRVQGLYPTIIVVLVCLQNTTEVSTISAMISPTLPTHTRSSIVFASFGRTASASTPNTGLTRRSVRTSRTSSVLHSPRTPVMRNTTVTLQIPLSAAGRDRLSTFLHVRPRTESFESLGLSDMSLLELVRTKSGGRKDGEH